MSSALAEGEALALHGIKLAITLRQLKELVRTLALLRGAPEARGLVDRIMWAEGLLTKELANLDNVLLRLHGGRARPAPSINAEAATGHDQPVIPVPLRRELSRTTPPRPLIAERVDLAVTELIQPLLANLWRQAQDAACFRFLLWRYQS